MRRKAAGFPAGKTFDSWREADPSIAIPTQAVLRTCPLTGISAVRGPGGLVSAYRQVLVSVDTSPNSRAPATCAWVPLPRSVVGATAAIPRSAAWFAPPATSRRPCRPEASPSETRVPKTSGTGGGARSRTEAPVPMTACGLGASGTVEEERYNDCGYRRRGGVGFRTVPGVRRDLSDQRKGGGDRRTTHSAAVVSARSRLARQPCGNAARHRCPGPHGAGPTTPNT